MSNISIQNESAEFLRLQALGTCSNKCQKRLTKLQLAYSTKELCNKLYTCLNDLYFGVKNGLQVELSKLENLLTEIKTKVSQCEQDLIDYIWMVVHGDKNDVAIQRLERHYKLNTCEYGCDSAYVKRS